MAGRHDYLTSERQPLQETGGIAYSAGIILVALMLGVMFLVLDLIGNKPRSVQVSRRRPIGSRSEDAISDVCGTTSL